jgi:hypothetical protein
MCPVWLLPKSREGIRKRNSATGHIKQLEHRTRELLGRCIGQPFGQGLVKLCLKYFFCLPAVEVRRFIDRFSHGAQHLVVKRLPDEIVERFAQFFFRHRRIAVGRLALQSIRQLGFGLDSLRQRGVRVQVHELHWGDSFNGSWLTSRTTKTLIQ